MKKTHYSVFISFVKSKRGKSRRNPGLLKGVADPEGKRTIVNNILNLSW